ncbi:MAG: hypothetical protein EB015_05505 [Methylocystaceae bacterium]|nr:hypothetical protein [Methylocystaceae bacterium]
MNPHDLLQQASEIISERGENYGGIEDNFQLVADLASLRLGRDIHPFEVATIMVCVKNARAFSDPTHIDSRLDAMNYEAFAAMFANDYVNQKSATGANIGYKKRANLTPAKKEELKPARRAELAVIDDKLSRFGSTEPPQFSGNSALLSD